MLQGTLQNRLEDMKSLLNTNHSTLNSFHKCFWLLPWVVGSKGVDVALLKYHAVHERELAVPGDNPLCLEQKWSRLKKSTRYFAELRKYITSVGDWLSLLRITYKCTFILLACLSIYRDRGGFLSCFLCLRLGWLPLPAPIHLALQVERGVSLTSTSQRNKNVKTDCSQNQIPYLC